jgi:hypothetical protein
MNFESFQTYAGQASVDILKFYNSPAFSVVKFMLGIYAVVIILDLILLLASRGVTANIRQTIFGMDVPKELTIRKEKLREQWAGVRERLGSYNESEYKVAIIEADNLIDELVAGMTYPGENMGERLDAVPPGQIESLQKLKEAHEIRNRIIHEENFQVSREDAKEVLAKYEAFLKEFDVL